MAPSVHTGSVYARMELPSAGLVLTPWRAAGTRRVLSSHSPAVTVEEEPRVSEEAALLAAAGAADRDGRENAFREVYHRYQRRLYGLGLSLLGDAGLAEELVQETSLRLCATPRASTAGG